LKEEEGRRRGTEMKIEGNIVTTATVAKRWMLLCILFFPWPQPARNTPIKIKHMTARGRKVGVV
jgi:hypothetical protein